MKEALRIHPGVAFPLERYVPPEGAVICGKAVPGGTNVSVNAAVIHVNKNVFGPDADQFRPERWIDASPEQLKLMDRSFLAVSSPFKPSCLSSSRVLITSTKVWLWCPNLYREEHIYPRNGQIHPSDFPPVRHGMGIAKTRMGTLSCVVLETDWTDSKIQGAMIMHRWSEGYVVYNALSPFHKLSSSSRRKCN